MSLATLASTRVYMENGGEEASLSFEKFPYIGLSKTYCLDRIVPDSSCTSTAYLTGVKTNYGIVGMNGQTQRSNCHDANNTNKYTHSIGEWFLNAKKEIGLVTTTRITHASPASLYANIPDRNWENDDIIKQKCGIHNNINDIAKQFVSGDIGKNIKVAFGGGRREFLPKSQNGLRDDNINLIQFWQNSNNQFKQKQKLNKKLKRVYVENKLELNQINLNETDQVLGLFESSHMKYHLETLNNQQNQQPTLAEMTEKAIQILNHNNPNGYFLFVEGGKIDLAHHSVHAKLAFDETLEFAKAIQLATELTNPNETLIVVSSDHSHTMTISGYPERKNNIIDVADISDLDQLPYLTLSYANGKAFEKYFNMKKNQRYNPKNIDRTSNRAEFPSTIKLNTETHGGEDVAVFATGPKAHLFTGVYEQNTLPHLMAYAANIQK